MSRFAENLIVNLDGKNIEIPYTDTVNNYGIHRDKITGGWLIVLENGAGQFFTFVCNEHGVAYSEDRIKYQCGLGNVCFITPISQYRLMEISEYIRTKNRHLKILSAKPYRRIAV